MAKRDVRSDSEKAFNCYSETEEREYDGKSLLKQSVKQVSQSIALLYVSFRAEWLA